MYLLLVAPGGQALACELRATLFVTADSAPRSIEVDFKPRRDLSDGLSKSAAVARKFAWRMLTASFVAQELRPQREMALLYEVKAPSFVADGRSGDLALTLAILLDLLGADGAGAHGRFPPLAATGTVEADGSVGRVEHVAAKVAAALVAFPSEPRACVFVPMANLPDIVPLYGEELRTGRIVPVARLQDALDEVAARELPVPDVLSFGQLRQPIVGNPYRGLNAFGQAERAFLFGRREEVADILRRLVPSVPLLPGVLILGASGSGKSSLLMAGVLGALMHGRVGGYDFSACASAPPWRPSQAASLDEAGLCASLRQHLRPWTRDAASTATGLRALADEVLERLDRDDPAQRLVLAIDQLEELFAAAISNDMVDTLEVLADFLERLQDGGCWIVATLRSEYLGWLGPLRRRVFRQDGEFELLPATSSDARRRFLREVILGPAELAAASVEPALLERLEDEAQSLNALPLLQFALDQLYVHAASRAMPGAASVQLTAADYEAFGGLEGAIDARAGALLAATPSLDHPLLLAALARLARQVEGEASWMRASVAWSDFSEVEQRWLAQWVDARLLARRGNVVEVSHEALLNHFDVLRQWLAQHQELLVWRQVRLLRDMRDWTARGRSADDLLPAKELKAAERALREPHLLSHQEADYAQRSIDANRLQLEQATALEHRRNEELETKNTLLARSQRGLRRRAWLLAALSVLAVGFGGVALIGQHKAEEAARRSSFAEMIQVSLSALEHSPDQASLSKLLVAFKVLGGEPAAEMAVLRASEILRSRSAIIDERSPKDAMLFALFPDGRPIVLRDFHLPSNRESERMAVFGLSSDGSLLAAAGVEEGSYFGPHDTDAVELAVDVWRLGAGGQPTQLVKQIDLMTKRDYRSELHTPKRLMFSPDGKQVLVQSRSDTLRLIDVALGKAVGKPWRIGAAVTALAFVDNGRLVTGHPDGALQLWNVANARPIGRQWRGHRDTVTSVVVLSGGSSAISTGYDGATRLWNLANGTSRELAAGSKIIAEPITVAALSPDGRWLLSGGLQGTLTIWDVEAGRQLGPSVTAHSALIDNLAFDASGRHFVSHSADNSVLAWSLRPRLPREGWQAHDAEVDAIAYSSDGRFVVTADRTGILRQWTTNDVPPAARTWKGDGTSVLSMAVSADGRRLALSDAKGNLSLRSADTGTEFHSEWLGMDGLVFSVAFSPDSKRLLAGFSPYDRPRRPEGPAFSLKLLDAATGAAIGRPWGLGTEDVGEILSMAYSPDGKRVVSGHGDGGLRLWDAETGGRLGKPWLGHDAPVRSVAFSADGREVVSGSEDKTLRRWNADDGTEIGPAIRGHMDEVVAVAYLYHGERIVSASSDGSVRYWNTTTGRQIGPAWLDHDFAVSGLAVAPDESEVLAATVDGLVHRLSTPSGAVKAMCELLGDVPVHSINLGLAAGTVACSAN